MKRSNVPAAVVVLAASAVLVGGCGGTKRRVEPTVSVPNLIGKDTMQAVALLRQRGLRWRWDESTNVGVANGFIGDEVVAQAPGIGQRVQPGTAVYIAPGSTKVHFRPNPILNPYGENVALWRQGGS